MWVTGGMIGTRMLPGMIAKVWAGIPRTGYAGYGVDIGSALLLSWGVKFLTKSNARMQQVLAGGLAATMLKIWDNELAPKIGLSGIGSEYVTNKEVDQILSGSLDGYVADPGGGVAGYVNQAPGQDIHMMA
jgi:hypothetical protein